MLLSEKILGPFQCNGLPLKKSSHCPRPQWLKEPGLHETRTLRGGNAKLSEPALRIPADEALARRYKGMNVSGDPRQVMWGPEDSERTESMASGCERTLPEEGRVCRL